MKERTIKAAYDNMMAERRAACKHTFVDGYDVSTGEAYKRCSKCGTERNRRAMSEEDANAYLGIINKLSAKGDKKRLGEQLHLNLDPNDG